MTADLQWLIDPIDTERFLQRTLSNQFAYAQGPNDRFASLWCFGDFREILARSDLRFPRVRLWIEGSQSAFQGNSLSDIPRLPLAALREQWGAGATLIVDSVDELHEPIGDLCSNLEQELNVPVQANVFSTLQNYIGLGRRWDDHDVIVLQIAGSSQWRIYRRIYSTHEPADSALVPVWEQLVTPGDVVYVPREWWHEVRATNAPTIQVVLGFRNPTVLDLAVQALREVGGTHFFRQDFPRFASPEIQGQYLKVMRNLIATSCGEPGLLLAYMKEMQALLEPRNLADLFAVAEHALSADLNDCLIVPLIRFRRSAILRHLENESAVEVLSGGQAIRVDESCVPLLQELLRSGPLSMTELIRRAPREFTDEAVRAFVKNLVRQRGAILRSL